MEINLFNLWLFLIHFKSTQHILMYMNIFCSWEFPRGMHSFPNSPDKGQRGIGVQLNSIVTGMPYLPASFSSQGVWKWYNFGQFLNRGYVINTAFHFLQVSLKKNILRENLIVIFANVPPIGFFWLNVKSFLISIDCHLSM